MKSALHPAVKLAENRLRIHLKKYMPNALVWLFGSRALEKAGRGSDFDLAVQLSGSDSAACLESFEEAVIADTEIIYPVDIVDLNTASSAIKDGVKRDGILWKS